MRRAVRIGAALLALGAATDGVAQTFNQSLLRYRAEQRACTGAHHRRVAGDCGTECRAAADIRLQQCRAVSERRYRAVLGRELRRRR